MIRLAHLKGEAYPLLIPVHSRETLPLIFIEPTMRYVHMYRVCDGEFIDLIKVSAGGHSFTSMTRQTRRLLK